MGRLTPSNWGTTKRQAQKHDEVSPNTEKRELSVLIITSRGLDPYTSLLANSLNNYLHVIVFGQTRKYLSDGIPFIQGFAPRQKPHSDERHSSSSQPFGTLLWIVGDFVHHFVDAVSLATTIRRLKPSFVHLQGHFPFFYILALGPLLSKNFFWTIHDVELRTSRYGVMDMINIVLTRVAVMTAILGLRSKAIIVHGDTLKREISKSWWARGKTYSIPHGNYDGIYDRLNVPKAKTPTAMFFGKIKPYKGLELFVQCAASLSSLIPSAHFVIAGAGDLTPYSSLIEEAGSELFEIDNQFISDEEIPRLFGKAWVIVLPYTKGSQSGVLALAYTMGVPVVASNVGSIPELVDHGRTGFIFESGNVTEMCNYVYTLLTNADLCEEFSKNARKKASLTLSWDEIAKKTLTLYSNLGMSHGWVKTFPGSPKLGLAGNSLARNFIFVRLVRFIKTDHERRHEA